MAKDDLKGPKPPKEVEERLQRGRERMQEGAAKRTEAFEFFRGNHYAYVDSKNLLQFQSTTTSVRTGEKPPWRQRRAVNLILDAVAHEVSQSTQRVPSYEIVPSTTDPEDVGAARLAQRVALFGHDKWGFRNIAVEAVTHAVVTGEAFAWPMWDSSIGPFTEDEDGNSIGLGDVRVLVFGGNQVFWEPGARFERSQWHGIDIAMPVEEAEALEGFLGGKLKPDADVLTRSSRGQEQPSKTRMVTVTYYLERPSKRNDEGSWLTLANGKQIVEERPYPSASAQGGYSDEPVLHKLSFIVDPDADRDMGLVKHLTDPQRIYNFARSKILEWVVASLNPQVFVTPGLMGDQRLTDEPLAVYEIPEPDKNVKWRETPDVPQELFQVLDQAKDEIARISAQNDIPSQVEAGRAIQALIERDASRRASFLAGLAEWYSRLMRACLQLVQERYTEPRLLKIKGRFGWESVKDFEGAELRGQCDVRVFPGSIEPRTKAQMESKVLAFADRQWITPEQAMAAIDGGYAEDLARSYELDISRAHRIIERIKEGPEALFSQPLRVVGQNPDGSPIEEPGWMPRRFDNIDVQKSTFEDWMKTEDFEMLDPPMQEAAGTYYDALLQLEVQKNAEAAAAQAQMAESLGMSNAAKPQGAKPMPDQRQPNGNGLPTPNQPPSQSVPTP
jgi:hypothetical protein